MKKLVTLALCLALLLSAFSFAEETANPYRIVPEGEEITISIGVIGSALTEDYENNTFTKKIEADTGLNIEVIPYSSNKTEAVTQLNLDLSAGNKVPDILFNFTMENAVINQMGEDGYFVDLLPLMEEYYSDEYTWKDPETLIGLLVRNVSLGGNLLMNVSPNARGDIDEKTLECLDVYAKWMRLHGRSVYGCTMAEKELLASCPENCRFTQSEDGKRLYVHLFAFPFAHLRLKGMAGKVRYAQFLHDNSIIKMSEGKMEHLGDGGEVAANDLILDMPVRRPDVVIPVIELFLK